MFWKKTQPATDGKIILGMILLKESLPFDPDRFQKDIRKTAGLKVSEFSGDANACVMTIDREMVAIGFVPVPVPGEDIQRAAAKPSYWENDLNALQQHQAHLIITIMHGSGDMIKRFRIFTAVACSLIRTNNAVGVYMGNQQLVIPTAGYLEEASQRRKDSFPLYLWINFGFAQDEFGRKSTWTNGLNEFDKTEMEILDSRRDGYDMVAFLYNIAHYVLDYNVTFQHGQTCGLSADERVPITLSPGRFTEGNTFKLGY